MPPFLALRTPLKLVVTVAAVLGAVPVRADDAPPRLALIIAVDQLRYDYLIRFRPYFVADGFERLLSGGTNFENCTYRYAATKTAVGHATMSTGAHPMVHGIVGNEWVEPETLLSVVSVEDVDSPLVGLARSTMRLPGGGLDPRSGRSPRRLVAGTVGDQLKATYGPQARVFGISNKDRSAILMAGARADGAYWDESGRIVTSRYYREELPDWVEAFNDRRLVEATFGTTWKRLLDPAVYDATQGPDEADGELVGLGLDPTFPHTLNGGLKHPGPDFYGAFDNSPEASEFLATFAREIIVNEHLGADATPDLLCVSFSQVDSIGHNYGPDSHEIMDSIVRLDRTLAAFLGWLDERVGAGRYVVVLTSDHGVAPNPERTAALHPHIPTARIRTRDLDASMAAALDSAFGAPPENDTWFVRDNQGYHLRPSALAARGVTREAAATVLRDALRLDARIESAWTRTEILAAPQSGDALLTLVRRSYFAGHGTDVHYVVKPWFVERSEYGTTHGSPWIYDRQVPQVWYGRGVPRAWRAEAVGMEDIAPTLAALLRIPTPLQSIGRTLF